jgi:hypothetical protein
MVLPSIAMARVGLARLVRVMAKATTDMVGWVERLPLLMLLLLLLLLLLRNVNNKNVQCMKRLMPSHAVALAKKEGRGPIVLSVRPRPLVTVAMMPTVFVQWTQRPALANVLIPHTTTTMKVKNK